MDGIEELASLLGSRSKTLSGILRYLDKKGNTPTYLRTSQKGDAIFKSAGIIPKGSRRIIKKGLRKTESYQQGKKERRSEVNAINYQKRKIKRAISGIEVEYSELIQEGYVKINDLKDTFRPILDIKTKNKTNAELEIIKETLKNSNKNSGIEPTMTVKATAELLEATAEPHTGLGYTIEKAKEQHPSDGWLYAMKRIDDKNSGDRDRRRITTRLEKTLGLR